jgi:hypothetical protein
MEATAKKRTMSEAANREAADRIFSSTKWRTKAEGVVRDNLEGAVIFATVKAMKEQVVVPYLTEKVTVEPNDLWSELFKSVNVDQVARMVLSRVLADWRR